MEDCYANSTKTLTTKLKRSNRSNGLECVVKDYVLDSPPPLGSVITVKHRGAHPNGLLNEPTYWRQLEDSAHMKIDITQVGIKIYNIITNYYTRHLTGEIPQATQSSLIT